ncbi:heterokaryon incompatibility protein-domain-containing protein [Xylariaceae sp. FL0016]|nr:heterokaryon incompatibility protein-domain-containing protein [Xylariaceae sp. FL0016]
MVLTTTAGNEKAKGTLKEHRKEILTDSRLPKTFRDAIAIVRFLGFRYIWIDSLCILQDRKEDWEAESKKMGEIYRNAQLTIVAAAATSGDSGCFEQIKPSSELPCHIGTVRTNQTCKKHVKHDFNLFAHARGNGDRDSDFAGFRPLSNLDSRGWVLQEEVLSGRSLIFTQKGVFWECVEMSASESYPRGTLSQQVGMRTPGTGGEACRPWRVNYGRRFKKDMLQMKYPSRPVPENMFNNITILDGQPRHHWQQFAGSYILGKEIDDNSRPSMASSALSNDYVETNTTQGSGKVR